MLGFGVVVIVTVVVVFIAGSSGDSRDERSYQRGLQLGGADDPHAVENFGGEAEDMCRELVEIEFAFGDNGLNVADVEQGCLDGLRSKLG